MNYGEAFTFMNKGQNWVSKILVGVLFALFLPLGGIGVIPLFGWSIAIGRRVIRGEVDALPEWSEIGSIIIDGLKMAVIWFIWNLPGLILGGLANLIDAPVAQALFGLCGGLYSLVIGILFLGVFGLLADEKPFIQAINPVYAWRVVSANWANTIVVWVLAIAGIIIASLIGTVLCGVGMILGWTYGFALGGHLYGQLYRESAMKGSAA
jgi:hypothetical protein